ncbi:acyclic terpene utilization AtuA family protein [Sphingomonas montanisoli]|uniref:DUF1446 domain-containing protein n=1 Tax=Sphingomonas montanisoli TaxID=2606412 RepID=A0A5D9CDV3_9SPHN|nr:acyclic terpene utilization AtuA family protein [Sphingomonas montanisoli]TZG29393.1 DUF1446 domain-containing protein [Sphingomonas montanisoli]
MSKTVRIGGASAFFSDSTLSVAQLLAADPAPQYLMFDFMSEGTIGMMARSLAVDPDGGYMRDFATVHIANNLNDIVAKKVKLIANAGGMNPKGCAAFVEKLLKERGVDLKVAYVEGDNLTGRGEEMRGIKEMFSGAGFPEKVDSINAYLGAFPIAAALDAGADIVVTGRCADSALGLGPLIHEFGWKADEWDKISAGTLVGHLLECGCQVTGGTFTDWEDVPDWVDIGYPLADVSEDGSCIITKPEGTGGLVSVGTVAEQLLYEVSDPQAYIVADVVCDFSDVKLEQAGKDKVKVSGARGYPATDSYKGVASYPIGWRGTYSQVIIGMDAAAKAKRMGEALVERGRKILRGRNIAEFDRADVDMIGSEFAYGPAGNSGAREVMMRASVDHAEQAPVELFLREASATTSAMAPGATATSGRTLVPLSKLFLFLVPKANVEVKVTVAGKTMVMPKAEAHPFDPATIARPTRPEPVAAGAGWAEVPLIKLAWGRSGDKGNLFNVAAIARKDAYLPYIRAALTPESVGQWFGHLYPEGVKPRVTMFDVPGFNAINFVVHDSMDGGILVSPKVDSAAKGMAQQLLEMPIKVPAELA